MGDKLSETLWLVYKAFFQPQFGNACKFHPSCSCYAKESFKYHNMFRASRLVLWRILRCHPFSRGGWDPVPGVVENKNGQ